MSLFIEVDIAFDRCVGLSDCGLCVRVCPVNIFVRDAGSGAQKSDLPALVKEAFDECTLCDLCLQNCRPDAIRVHKLYEKDGSEPSRTI